MIEHILSRDSSTLNTLSVNDLCDWVKECRSRSAEYGGDNLIDASDEHQVKHNILHLEELLEKKVALSYLNDDIQFIDRYMDIVSRPYYAAEAKYLSHYGDRVCFIGSGSIPHSAIVYYEEEGLKSTIVEKNRDALLLSKSVLNKRYGKKIVDAFFCFKTSCGEDLLCLEPECQLSVIAGHCSNKVAVLEALYRILPSNSRILLRRPKGLYRYAYEETIDRLKDSYSILNDGVKIGSSTILENPIVIFK